MSYKIFVQIASYRDPELIPTVLDLVEKAKNPEFLRIVVAWQHDDNETLEPIKHLIEYIDIPYVESKGVCWARNLIQQKYNDEEYTLQLDSHHRFIQNWDEQLIEMYNKCKEMGSEKPLITGYLPHYDPDKEEFLQEVWKMNLEKFMDEGPMFFIPEPLTEIYDNPIPSRFYSGHFAFTDGKFSVLVQHDSNYYFYGEETNIGVRAYTHGYDLYHPNKIIAWHYYTREKRPKHWDDHIIEGSDWSKLDNDSTNRHKKLFGMDGFDKLIDSIYNFGNVRTIEDYETYAGIRFKDRYISEYTQNNFLPPNPIE
jgi:hypothetical protein